MIHLVGTSLIQRIVLEKAAYSGEILYNAEQGINSFIIVQPFACLANHISGRRLKRLKKIPAYSVLSLDYDPDTSFANIENRLQMLIINARELERRLSKSLLLISLKQREYSTSLCFYF